MGRSKDPFYFVKVGKRWINMALVTDVRDHGDKMAVYLTAPMLTKAGDDTIATGRRIVLTDDDEVAAFRKWILLHDESTGI